MRGVAGGFEKAKANHQDATNKAVLTTGETNVRRISKYRDTEEKMLDVIQLLEDVVVIYEKNGNKQNLARTEEEIDKVAKDTDKEISRLRLSGLAYRGISRF